MRREITSTHTTSLCARSICAVALLSLVLACGDHKQGKTQGSSADAQLAALPEGAPGGGSSNSGFNDLPSEADADSAAAIRKACLRDHTQPDSAPNLQPWKAGGTPVRDTVPLRVGLTVVTAIATPDGDYESVKTITDLSGNLVSLDLSAVVPKWDGLSKKTVPTPLNSRRNVLVADQDTACGFAPVFMSMPTTSPPEIDTGTTGITFSARLLAAIKTGHSVYVRLMMPDFGSLEERGRCIRRVEPHPVGVPVILNDQPVVLPAVHAQCDTTNTFTIARNGTEVHYVDCEYFILDDPKNPIVLT